MQNCLGARQGPSHSWPGTIAGGSFPGVLPRLSLQGLILHHFSLCQASTESVSIASVSCQGWVRGLVPQGLFIPSKSDGEEVRSPCREAVHFAGLFLLHNNHESHHWESSLHALCRTKLCTDISLVCFPGALRNIYCFHSHFSDGHLLSSAQLYRQRKGRVKGVGGSEGGSGTASPWLAADFSLLTPQIPRQGLP